MRTSMKKSMVAVVLTGTLIMQTSIYAGELIDYMPEADSNEFSEELFIYDDEVVLDDANNILEDLESETEFDVLEDIAEDELSLEDEYIEEEELSDADSFAEEDSVLDYTEGLVEESGQLSTEEADFEKGYVQIEKDTPVYVNVDGIDLAGTFGELSTVFAEVYQRAEERDNDWLKITFDTSASYDTGEDFYTGYVQFKDVKVLTKEEADRLVADLQNEYPVRFNEDVPIFVVDFRETVADNETIEENWSAEAVEDIASASVGGTGSVTIVTQPRDISAREGDKVTLSIEAENATGYRWWYSKDGTNWLDCTETYYTGCKTDTIVFDALTKRNGWQFKCVVTGENGPIESKPAVFTIIGDGVNIVTQPCDVSAREGDKVTLSIEAANATGYQWKYSKDGVTWYDCTVTYYDGCKTPSVKFDALQKRNGWQFKCAVTGENGPIESKPAVLTIVGDKAKIITQPNDVSAREGEKVTLSIEAANATGYQWKYSKDGVTWYDCTVTYYDGCKTPSVEFDALAKRDGWQYKCTVTGSDGNTVDSAVATLTIIEPIIVDEVTYEKITDTTLAVVAYSGSASALVIPEIVQGMTVTEIGEGAFENNTILEEIDLPDTISVIGKRAFKNCSNLSSMY